MITTTGLSVLQTLLQLLHHSLTQDARAQKQQTHDVPHSNYSHISYLGGLTESLK